MCRLWMIYFLNLAISVANCYELFDWPSFTTQQQVPGFQGAVPVLAVGKRTTHHSLKPKSPAFRNYQKVSLTFFQFLNRFQWYWMDLSDCLRIAYPQFQWTMIMFPLKMANNLWASIFFKQSLEVYSTVLRFVQTARYYCIHTHTHTPSMFGNLTTDIHFFGNPAIQNLAFLRRPSQHMSTSPSGFPKLGIHGKLINLYITELTSSSASLGKKHLTYSELNYQLSCAWETQFIAPTGSLFDRDYEYPNRSESLPSNHCFFFPLQPGSHPHEHDA